MQEQNAHLRIVGFEFVGAVPVPWPASRVGEAAAVIAIDAPPVFRCYLIEDLFIKLGEEFLLLRQVAAKVLNFRGSCEFGIQISFVPDIQIGTVVEVEDTYY